jgi:hypothetical protein
MFSVRRALWASLVLAVVVPVVAAAAQARGNPSATGGGTTQELGETSTFTFNAVQRPNGSVTGHLVYHIRAADLTIHMDIDCLSISGNTARLSGEVTHLQGDPPDYVFVGQDAEFTVQDNGEGSQAPPDLFSDVFLFTGATCHDAFPPDPYLPTQGNIQVG